MIDRTVKASNRFNVIVKSFNTTDFKLKDNGSSDLNESSNNQDTQLKKNCLYITKNVEYDIIETTKLLKIKQLDKKFFNCNNDIQFTARHLSIENDMFDFIQAKLNDRIKLSREVSVVDKKNKFITCLLCNFTVAVDKLHVYHDHLQSQRHANNTLETRNKNTFHNLLLKQFMINVTESSLKCYSCDILRIAKGNLKHHIKTYNHKLNYKTCNSNTTEYFEKFRYALNDVWYNIAYYVCAFCGVKTIFKIEFLEHLSKIHVKNQFNVKDMFFDFCIPCATLWMGKENMYKQHLTDLMHVYLLEKEDFMVGKIPKCASDLLKKSVTVANDLFKHCLDVETRDNEYIKVKESLSATLKIFPEMKMHLFGSRITGLASKNSDMDIFINLENTSDGRCGTGSNLPLIHLQKVEKELRKDDKNWKINRVITTATVPIIKLCHRNTGMDCDLSFSEEVKIAGSQLLRRYCTHLLCKKLILFIRKWASLCYLNKCTEGIISNYALAWCVIFFLQRKGLVPSVASLIEKQSPNKKFICGWQVCPDHDKIFIDDTCDIKFDALLLEFFLYYEKFDYRHDVICPLLGTTVPKKIFTCTKIDNMDVYTQRLKSKEIKYFKIDPTMCVQDPYRLSDNLAKSAKVLTVNCFRKYCGQCASTLAKHISA